MSRNDPPPMAELRCGCQYNHEYEEGGPGCGPSGWERKQYPDYPCKQHEAEELKRRADVAQRAAILQERSKKHEMELLEQEAAKIEENARVARARIAQRRYVLQHGVDRSKIEIDLKNARELVARLEAQLQTLPPMPEY